MHDRRRPARGRTQSRFSGTFAPGLGLGAALVSLGCIPTDPNGGLIVAAPEVRLGDCATAEQGLEFFAMIGDFEDGTARYLYSYTDNTSTISPTGYQPPAEPGTHCSSDPGHAVFHVRGGPFLGWGGGLGVSMEHLAHGNCDTNGKCDNINALCSGSPLPSFCYPPGPDLNVSNSILDVSEWDGVAIWARRGSQGQPLLRVLVGNKYTDDDISFFMYLSDRTQPRYCERVRECACINGLSCTFADHTAATGVPLAGGTYCGAPGIVAGPDISASDDEHLPTNACGMTRCDDVYAAHPDHGAVAASSGNPAIPGFDPQFFGRQCRPFTYRTGVSSSFCFDPDAAPPSDRFPNGRGPDPTPAENDQQCGDHWTYPMHLSTDWQLHLVPFASMFQQGFAKRFPFFDLKSVSVVRLTWDAGPVDFYIDNWRFYRVARPAK